MIGIHYNVQEEVRHKRLQTLAKMALDSAMKGCTVKQIDNAIRNYAAITWAVSINTQREYAKTAIYIACKNAMDAAHFVEDKSIQDATFDYATTLIQIAQDQKQLELKQTIQIEKRQSADLPYQ